MIMFNTHMTQFTCSHHGIPILEKITTYLDAKDKYKRTCFLCEELIKIKTPDFTRGKLHERVKLFSMKQFYSLMKFSTCEIRSLDFD